MLHLHFKQLNPAIVFDAQACALIGVCAQFTSISATNSLAQERLTPRHQFASSQFQLSNLFCNTFAGKVLCGLELMAIALQASNSHTYTHTHIEPVHGHVQYPQPCKQKFSKTSHRCESNKFNLSGLARSLSQYVANPFTISK